MLDGTAPATTAAIVDRRSDRLARGLLSLGLTTGDRVVVLCCENHKTDRAVGYRGCQKADLQPVMLPLAVPIESLRTHLKSSRPQLILACSEGVTAWRQTGVACRVVGDEPGVTWWKLLEARHPAA
jgi:non-ribosomal peptide synthetase component F